MMNRNRKAAGVLGVCLVLGVGLSESLEDCAPVTPQQIREQSGRALDNLCRMRALYKASRALDGSVVSQLDGAVVSQANDAR